MKDLLQKDAKYLWHPYTQMKDLETMPPIIVEKAEGIKIYDNTGKVYYDTISSWWCNIHGHNHPKIKQAMKDQLDRFEHVMFAGFTHEPAVKLAEMLMEITPDNLTHMFYSDNGSTAVETALKMSLQYWKMAGKPEKTKYVSLDYGYHGDTIGAMSVSSVDEFNKAYSPLFFESFKTPSPYCYRCPLGRERCSCNIECADSLEKIVRENCDQISAMILEPMVMGAGGMIVYPAEYLAKAEKICRKYDIHLIVDEVAVGFGRTGKMFASEHADIKPDFMAVSKGITSGYLPLAATLTTDDIYNAFYDDYEKGKTFFHGHTYTGNPVGCAAGVATLEIFKEEDTLNAMKPTMNLLHERLDQIADLPWVGDIRKLGMIGAVELVEDKATKKRFDWKKRVGLQVYREGLKRGLQLRPLGSVVYFFLPLCTKQDELNYVFDNFVEILKTIEFK